MTHNMFAARTPWRPAPGAPAFRPTPQRLGRRGALGQASGMPLAVDVLTLGIAAAATYVGIRAGLNDKGFPSALGWVVGITGGLRALQLAAVLVLEQLASGSPLSEAERESVRNATPAPTPTVEI